jgi:hypothetical protein
VTRRGACLLTACGALLLASCGQQDAPAPSTAPATQAAPGAGPAAPSVAAAPIASAPAPLANAQAPAPRIALAGVVAFGAADPRSQALLEVEGAAAQVFHPGETIAQGWQLRTVAADHVVIAQGTNTQRIALSAPSRATTAAAAASASRAAAADKPLTGFVQSAPPRFSANDGQASQRNRAFLDAVEAGRAQRQASQQR